MAEKYAMGPVVKDPELSVYLPWEGDTRYTRDVISVTTSTPLPKGTILEIVSEQWVKASAGTGRMGMLVHDLAGSESPQEAVVVTRMACFDKKNMLIESGIKDTAVGTLTTQGIKVV